MSRCLLGAILIAVLVPLSVSACTQPTPQVIVNTVEVTRIVEKEAQPIVQTVVVTATPSHTPDPTRTPLPTSMPTSTPVPTRSPTPTPVPPTATPIPTTDPDPDNDGVQTWEEQVYGTDPNVAQNWSDFDFVSSVLNTPKRISTYLAYRLSFIYDDPSNPNYTAPETFQRGGGDCEDLAAFAVHNLRRTGVSSSILDVQWGNLDAAEALGHAVALYSDEQSYWYIDTGVYSHGRIVGPFQSLTQAANSVNSSWIRWSRFSETFELEERVYK